MAVHTHILHLTYVHALCMGGIAWCFSLQHASRPDRRGWLPKGGLRVARVSTLPPSPPPRSLPFRDLGQDSYPWMRGTWFAARGWDCRDVEPGWEGEVHSHSRREALLPFAVLWGLGRASQVDLERAFVRLHRRGKVGSARLSLLVRSCLFKTDLSQVLTSRRVRHTTPLGLPSWRPRPSAIHEAARPAWRLMDVVVAVVCASGKTGLALCMYITTDVTGQPLGLLPRACMPFDMQGRRWGRDTGGITSGSFRARSSPGRFLTSFSSSFARSTVSKGK